jgi:MFS family permease
MFQAIATVAMPRAIADLNGFARYSWPSTLFSLTSAIAMLVFAKLSDLYGRKLLCLFSTAMFICSLLFAGTAGAWPIPIDGMNQLVVGHALLGLSSGAIVGLTYTLIGDLFPPSERACYLGLLMVGWTLAYVTGPGIRGWITDNLSWRWAYIASAPLGIIAITTIYFRLPGIRLLLARRTIDWAGIAILCG